MTFTEDEEKVIEAMARAACEADGYAPDLAHKAKEANLFAYVAESRRHYAMQKAMMAHIALQETLKRAKETNARIEFERNARLNPLVRIE